MFAMRRALLLLPLFLIASSGQKSGGIREIKLADLHDKIEGGWAGADDRRQFRRAHGIPFPPADQ